jgi:hypothetical protein
MKSTPETTWKPGLAYATTTTTVGAGGSETVTGAAIDTQSFDVIEVRVIPGDVTGGTVAFAVQSSVNGTDGWTTIAPTAIVFDENSTPTFYSGLIRLATQPRYLRVAALITGAQGATAEWTAVYTLANPAYGSDQDYAYFFNVT